MESRSNKPDEEGWHIVCSDWWHTPYHSISWAYSPANPISTTLKPLYYHGALFEASGTTFSSSPWSQHTDANEAELVLNTDLCGVQSAMGIILSYEASVGIPPVEAIRDTSSAAGRSRDISLEVGEDELALARELWDKVAEDLFMLPESETLVIFSTDELSGGSSPSSSHGDLAQSTSSLSSVDLNDSVLSFNSTSRPPTPLHKATEPIVEVKDASPMKGTFFARPLNASASSFIPSSMVAAKPDVPCDTASQPFVNFVFPAFEVPPAPVVKLRKDDQGFYSKEEVEVPVPETTFLPPFLQRPAPRRKTATSKTRAIIDRFRSSQGVSNEASCASQSLSPTPIPPLYDSCLFEERISVSEDGGNRSGKSSPSSLNEDGEGWINVSEVNPDPKARQTRNLFLAFTRRRSGASSPAESTALGGDDTAELEIPTTSSPTLLTPPVMYSSNDGWVESLPASSSPKPEIKPFPASPESRLRSHRRRRSSQAQILSVPNVPAAFLPSSAPATVLRHPPFPVVTSHFPTQPAAPYIYAPYPGVMTPMAYTSYMHQLQIQMQQLQMCTVAGAGTGGGSGALRGRKTSLANNAGEMFCFPNPLAKPFTTPNMPPLMNPPIVAVPRRGSLW